MYVDGVNTIVKFVYISIAHLMRGPLNPSLLVIACKGSQTDSLPSFIPQNGREGSLHARGPARRGPILGQFSSGTAGLIPAIASTRERL